MSATVERIQLIRVAPTGDSVLLAMDGLKEDVRLVIDMDRDMAHRLTLDLIAAGFGPVQRGGRA